MEGGLWNERGIYQCFYFSKNRIFFRPKFSALRDQKISALRADPPRNAITKSTANKSVFISAVVKAARRIRIFGGFGTPVVQFALIFAT